MCAHLYMCVFRRERQGVCVQSEIFKYYTPIQRVFVQKADLRSLCMQMLSILQQNKKKMNGSAQSKQFLRTYDFHMFTGYVLTFNISQR